MYYYPVHKSPSQILSEAGYPAIAEGDRPDMNDNRLHAITHHGYVSMHLDVSISPK